MAVAVIDPYHPELKYYWQRYADDETNTLNRAALLSACLAIKVIYDLGGRSPEIAIRTDSPYLAHIWAHLEEYRLNHFTGKNGSRLPNADLIKKLYTLSTVTPLVNVFYNGHSEDSRFTASARFLANYFTKLPFDLELRPESDLPKKKVREKQHGLERSDNGKPGKLLTIVTQEDE
jgi:hypothetical protein